MNYIKWICKSRTGEPDYVITKLLLNALYGRFGMNPIMLKSKIVLDSELDKFIANQKIE